MTTAQTTDADNVDRPLDARRARMLAEVRSGLMDRPRQLPSKYFYDERGSRLFEEITGLAEYYPTRTERALLEAFAPGVVAALQPRTLVELGAGSAAKTRIILDAMARATIADLYAPIDVSAQFLAATARRLRQEYDGLDVRPVVTDIGVALDAPEPRPRPALFVFLGGTIGNFAAPDAVALLRRVRAAMARGDRLLMGVDLHKDRERLEAAYNDARGVTADFNRNVLRVLNRALGADFDVSAFRHRAFYNTRLHRIEMHLVSERAQTVTVPGVGRVEFDAGETIRTEISCKYTRPRTAELFTASCLRLERWMTDDEDLFALALAAPV